MRFWQIFSRWGRVGGWQRELLLTAVALILGFGLMPVLIFFAGSALLGRYEGASVQRLFANIYTGLERGSAASWIVLLGPYGLLLVFRGLRFWWRAGT